MGVSDYDIDGTKVFASCQHVGEDQSYGRKYKPLPARLEALEQRSRSMCQLCVRENMHGT